MTRGRPLDVEQELLEEFERNGRVTEYLVNVLPDASGACRRQPAAAAPLPRSWRTSRASAARLENWAAHRSAPLDRLTVTRSQAQRALRQSTADLLALFAAAVSARHARVKGMPRRVVNMLLYLIQHDAHHRGQIFMLAKSLGHEFRGEDVMRVWGWKACRSATNVEARKPRRLS